MVPPDNNVSATPEPAPAAGPVRVSTDLPLSVSGEIDTGSADPIPAAWHQAMGEAADDDMAWPVGQTRARVLMLGGIGAVLGVAGALFLCFHSTGGDGMAFAPPLPVSAPAVAPPPAPVARPVPVTVVARPAEAPAVVEVEKTARATEPAAGEAVAAAPALPAVDLPGQTATDKPVVVDQVAFDDAINKCQIAYASEKYSSIVVACGKALELDPDAAAVMAILSNAELDRGNYSSARHWAQKALEQDPSLPEPYAYLGYVEEQAGRHEDALVAYRRYLKLAPSGRYAEDLRSILRKN